MLRCYFLNHPSDLVNLYTWFTYRYGLVQCLLGYLNHFGFYTLLGLTIEYSEVVISMITIEVRGYIYVYLVSKVERTGWGDTVDNAFIDWYANWFGKPHKSYRRRISSLRDNIIENESIYVFFCQRWSFFCLLLDEVFCVFESFTCYLSSNSEFLIYFVLLWIAYWEGMIGGASYYPNLGLGFPT